MEDSLPLGGSVKFVSRSGIFPVDQQKKQKDVDGQVKYGLLYNRFRVFAAVEEVGNLIEGKEDAQKSLYYLCVFKL